MYLLEIKLNALSVLTVKKYKYSTNFEYLVKKKNHVELL